MKRSADIPNNALPPISFSKDSGNPRLEYASDSVTAAECSSNPDCKAFTLVVPHNQSSATGYLKSTTGPTTYTEGIFVFIKN
jgi:hypothetical protein